MIPTSKDINVAMWQIDKTHKIYRETVSLTLRLKNTKIIVGHAIKDVADPTAMFVVPRIGNTRGRSVHIDFTTDSKILTKVWEEPMQELLNQMFK